MIVVADTTPLNYLVLIGHIGILPKLFDQILVPRAVVLELRHPDAPIEVRDWIAKPPKWLNVRRIVRVEPALEYLGAGEQQAITLALRAGVDAILIDERVARREAKQRNLSIIGTLAILDEADRHNLLNFNDAIHRLHHTSFRISPSLLRGFVQRRRQ